MLEIMEEVLRINKIENLDAMAYFYGHTNSLEVRIFKGQDYETHSKPAIYEKRVYLDGELFEGYELYDMLQDLKGIK